MNALSDFDIESELSYAYIHAIAARAGMECIIKSRHSDNRGVDAAITGWGLDTGMHKNTATIDIQLKATITTPHRSNGYLSYFLKEIDQYDKLRANSYQIPRFLVVLFLPKNQVDWLGINDDQLILKHCAYWVSLLGAPECDNKTGKTIYISESNIFNPDGLINLLTNAAKRVEMYYRIPQ